MRELLGSATAGADPSELKGLLDSGFKAHATFRIT